MTPDRLALVLAYAWHTDLRYCRIVAENAKR